MNEVILETARIRLLKLKHYELENETLKKIIRDLHEENTELRSSLKTYKIHKNLYQITFKKNKIELNKITDEL